MDVLEQLLRSGKDVLGQLGGEAGVEKLTRFLATRGSTPLAQESAREAFSSATPAQREDIGHGLLGYLRNFHHPEADNAAAHAGDLTNVDALSNLFSSVLTVNPRFLEEVSRILFGGVPAEAGNEHGPQAWLVSLLKSPAVMEAFKTVFARMSQTLTPGGAALH